MLYIVISLGVLILLLIYGAFRMSYEIKDLENQIFFWILYGVSVVTIFLFIFCIYIFIKFRKKNGSLGPRGFIGNPGAKGDPGTCDQILCRSRNIAILMEQIIENHTHAPVKNEIKKQICGFVNQEVNFKAFKEWNLLDVKMFRDFFTFEISKHTKEQIENDFKEPEEKGEVQLEILKNVVEKWDDYIGTDSKKKISVVFEKCE